MAIHARAVPTRLPSLPLPPLDSPSKVIRAIITSKEQQLFPPSTSYSPVAKHQQQEAQSEAQSLGITKVTYISVMRRRKNYKENVSKIDVKYMEFEEKKKRNIPFFARR